ncbi:hypothetical protein [Mycolicibacter sinensis]|uniref:Linalool dehydratase/isomerase domain-containing protein n=1 Tax=Mycolicibacter sinensis (strain JDM601) TaxID=875328 RepID=A0A1A2EEQ2_MYCSD|nr:hypothetical protein [Mycolicibacter sinensis]OBG02565.1 hypothetical protein A5772_07515 [Mycolicibacter sinensis]OBG03065.1 hypothetical protein A5771_14050 [Mycolicibacter sinensis]
MSTLLDNATRESGTDSTDLPRRSKFNGPVASRRLRRSATGYLLIAVIGVLPTLFGLSTAWQAAGLGLLFPGAGFLVFGSWTLLGITISVLVFAVACIAWFATGNVVAPVVAWLGAVAVAGGLAPAHPQPAPLLGAMGVALVIVGVIVVLAIVRRVLAVRRSARLRAERASYLPADLDALQRRLLPEDPAPRELDEIQLGHVKWLLSLGLQPVNQFNGFDIIEQFQPSALRYQINHVQYALAQVQRHYTPNFHGYLSVAQEQLIEKLTVPKVWKYWRLERLWGRLSTHYDPAGFENIMLTGWSGICLNTYSANTSSDRFARAGALEFGLGDPKKTYRHDAHSFNASLMWNFGRSPQTVFACEPNWTYSACNIYGLNSVASYDAAFGTRYLDALREPFLRGMREELMTPGGELIPFRSDYTGISIPFGGEVMYFQAAGWIAPVYPEVARTLWAIACREVLDIHNGGLEAYLAKPFMLDSGNYRSTGMYARGVILFAAREFGDQQIADAAHQALDAYNEPVAQDGMRRYANGSTFANALVAQGLLTQRGDWTRLITQPAPESARTGPILQHVAFEQVMVAYAVSDGDDLRLVLRGNSTASVADAPLRLARLRPKSRYEAWVDGQCIAFTSDENGGATVAVRVGSRTVVNIVPAR